MAKSPISNAFSNYDNVIKPQDEQNGFLNKLTSKFTNSLGFFSSDDIKLSNKLASLKSKFDIKGSIGKLDNLAVGVMQQSISMIGDMIKDTSIQLLNAGKSFLLNTVDDLISNIKKSIYIPDLAFCKSLKALYYAGADLAYNEHYIRLNCLKNDWNESLKFVDSEYEIDYNITYKDLERDLDLCTKNSCYKNTHYIFSKLYKYYISLKSEADTIEYKHKTYYSDPSDKNDPLYKEKLKAAKEARNTNIYKAEVRTLADLNRDIKKYEQIILKNMKNLIVYSYTYFNAGALKSFFNDFLLILKPKYFGTTDDRFSKAYRFTSSDMNIMAPFHTQNTMTENDKSLIDLNKTTNDILIDSTQQDSFAKETSANTKAVDDYMSAMNAGGKASREAKNMMSKINTNNKIARFRNDFTAKQAERSDILQKTAITKGSAGVYKDSRARYPQNKDKTIVKFRKTNIGSLLDSAFNDNGKLIEPRNKNFKQIYVYLASNEIFGKDRMVNDDFYIRCKYKTSQVLTQGLDKIKGILGASPLTQSLFDVSDAIDGSAYRYLLKVQEYLFNPKENTSITKFFDNYNDIINDFTLKDMINDPEILDAITEQQTEAEKESNTQISGTDGANIGKEGIDNSYVNHNAYDTVNDYITRVEDKLESLLEDDFEAQKLINIDFAFIDNIPMITKRNLLVKYLKFYYEELINSNIPIEEISNYYAILVFNVFGISGHTNIDKIYMLFDTITNELLTKSIKIMCIVYRLGIIKDFLSCNNSDFAKVYQKEYAIMGGLFCRDVRCIGFTKALYNYDYQYLQTLTRQAYDARRSYLNKISSKESPLFNDFWAGLDVTSHYFTGFNRSGILGWDDEEQRIKYTEYETNDWNDVKCTYKNGTFISGHDFTQSQGIKRWDDKSDDIFDTNITSGTWEIINTHKETFFRDINNKHAIFYWDGFNIVKTNISDSDEYELFETPNECVILASKNSNNGILYWDDSSKQFVRIDSYGGDFVYQETLNGCCLYSKTRTSGVYMCDSNKPYKIENVNCIVNSVSDVEGTLDLSIKSTTTEGSNSSSGSQNEQSSSTTTTSTVYVYRLLIGAKDGCYHAFSYNETKNYPTEMTGEKLSLFNNINVGFVKRGDSDYYAITPISINYIGLQLTDSKSVDGSNTGSILGYVNSSDFNKNFIDTNIVQKLVNYIDIQCVSDGIFGLNSQSEDQHWEFIDKNHIGTTVTLPVIKESISEIKFKDLRNLFIYAATKTNILYFDKETNTEEPKFSEILNSEDQVEGWFFNYIDDNSVFLLNYKNKKGIRYFSMKNHIASTTNINDGKWKVNKTRTKFIAMSYDGTNKGIRYCNYNTDSCTFVNLEPRAITIGDYSSSDYNTKKQKLFITTLRNNSVINIYDIKYDIDEFIYNLDTYKMQNILTNLFNDSTESTALNIINLFKNNKIFTKIDEKGNINLIKPDNTHTLSELLNILDLAYKEFDSTIATAITSSGLFTDMLTYAESQYEFDIDDEKAKAKIGAALLLLYSARDDFSENRSINYYEILARYRASERKMIIQNDTDFSTGDKISEEVGSSDWNKLYDHGSIDFIDSDDESVYIPH